LVDTGSLAHTYREEKEDNKVMEDVLQSFVKMFSPNLTAQKLAAEA